jgi:sugar lactone lactonase YvrE
MPNTMPFPRASRLGLSAVALLLNLPLLHAQVVSTPKVVVDAEIGHALTASGSPIRLANPAGVATAPDGTVYVADSSNSRIVMISTDGSISEKPATRVARIAANATFLEPSEGLSQPNAVAVGPDGTLYFSDAGKKTLYRVTNPETSSPTYTQLSYAATQTPSALAVDPSGNLWVADARRKEIIEFAVNATTATKKASVSPMEPTGLAVSGSALYFTDAASNAVYGQGSATPLLTQFADAGFNFAADLAENRPTGLGIDPAGNLYVLDAAGKRVIEFNPDSPSTAFLVPTSRLGSPASMTVASTGNLYLTSEQSLTELIYNGNSINFGSLDAGKKSSSVTLNYSFNAEVAEPKFYQNSIGNFVIENDECLSGRITAGFTCQQQVHVNFKKGTSGPQKGSVGLATKNDSVLGALPAATTVNAAILAFFPGTWSTLPETGNGIPNLLEPQGVVGSADGTSLYVADEGGIQANNGTYTYTGALYSYPWGANGYTGAKPTQLGASTFKTPSAVAIDASGNLWVADYTLGAVYTLTGNKLNTITKKTIPSGIVLNHPIALAFDDANNLYIGDTGPLGSAATAASPGFVVRVAANFASATKISTTISGASVIFPQALTTDGTNLYIADGGDQTNTFGSLVVVPGGNGTPAYISTGSYQLNGPSGLGFDPALDLYVLDGYNSRAFYIPVTLGTGNKPSFGTIQLFPEDLPIDTGAAMYVWPSGQQFTFTDIGSPPSPLTQVSTLDTSTASLGFGPIPLGSTQTQAVTALNVGNRAANYYTNVRSGSGAAQFTYNSTTCNNVSPGNTCAINLTYKPTSASATGLFQFYYTPPNFQENDINVSGTASKSTPTIALVLSNTSLTYPTGLSTRTTVSGNFGAVTGTVSLYDGTTLLGTGTLAGGIANIPVANGVLHVGSHSLTAVYNGNATYNTVTSAPPQVITVAAGATTASNPTCFGLLGFLYCQANITSASGYAVTGTAVFTVTGPRNQTYPVNVGGGGYVAFNAGLPLGTYNVTVTFATQGDWTGSSAGPVPVNNVLF